MAVSSTVCSVSLVLAFALLLSFTEGRDHLVGGKADAWKVPSSESQTLNKWAEKNRFLIGDYLEWKYDSKKDSVLEVTREAYLSCNTTNPLSAHQDGATKVKLEKSGPHYFISGTQGSCEKGEKLLVVVLAHRGHGRRSGGVSPTMAPAPAPMALTPAVPPTSGASSLSGGVIMVAVGVLAGVLMI